MWRSPSVSVSAWLSFLISYGRNRFWFYIWPYLKIIYIERGISCPNSYITRCNLVA